MLENNSNIATTDSASNISQLEPLMQSAYNNDKFIDALYYADKILAVDADKLTAQRYYAKSLFKLISFDKIINYLENVVSEFSNFDDVKDLGLVYFAIGNYEKALDYFLKANGEYPNDYIVNLHIAYCYVNLQSFDKAVTYFLNSLKINPESVDVYNYLFNIYFIDTEKYSNEISELLELLKENVNKTQSKKLIELIANFYQKLGRFEDALSYYNKLIDLMPDSPYFVSRAYIKYLLGDMPGAVTDVKTALNLDFNNTNAQDFLLLLVKQNYLDKNDPDAKRVIDYVIENGIVTRSYALACEFKADLMVDMQDFTGAVDLYKKAIDYYGTIQYSDVSLLTKYANILLQNNNIDDAIDILQQILQIDANNVDAMQKLATVYMQKGEIDKAGELIEKIKQIKNG